MKVLMKPVDMIALFTKDGNPTPIKYQIPSEENEIITIKVDRIITRDEEKFAGTRVIIYKCQSVINGIERLYELKYEVITCKWYLFKM